MSRSQFYKNDLTLTLTQWLWSSNLTYIWSRCTTIPSDRSRISRWGRHRPFGGEPPMHTLFSKNIFENKRIGSCWGARQQRPLDPPTIPKMKFLCQSIQKVSPKWTDRETAIQTHRPSEIITFPHTRAVKIAKFESKPWADSHSESDLWRYQSTGFYLKISAGPT